MAFLDKLLKRSQKEEPVVAPSCPHGAMVPKWARLEDMGKEDLISSYHCPACGQDFSKEEGERIRALEASRLQREAAELEELARRAEEEKESQRTDS